MTDKLSFEERHRRWFTGFRILFGQEPDPSENAIWARSVTISEVLELLRSEELHGHYGSLLSRNGYTCFSDGVKWLEEKLK